MKVTIFQLPLSGSPAKAGSASASSTARPFNSLSRDHANNISERRCTGKRLSTPSLGITRRSRATFRFTAPQQTFQLPPSGSPTLVREQRATAGRFVLSTPSLGITLRRDLLHADMEPRLRLLSTPSLGITVRQIVEMGRREERDFQLPLSGSQREHKLQPR